MTTSQLRLVTTSNASVVNRPLETGICIPNQRHVAAGAIITTQSAAARLPLAPRRKHQSNRKHRPAQPYLRLVNYCRLPEMNYQIAH